MEAQPTPETWHEFREALRRTVTPVTWQTWLDPLRPETVHDGTVRLLAPSQFHLRWVREKHLATIEHAIAATFGAATRV